MLRMVALFGLFITGVIFAAEKNYGMAKVARITSVYDGDTFRCHLSGYPPIIGNSIGIRVYGVDCPEMRDKRPEIKKKAKRAREYTYMRLMEAKEIKLVNIQRGKYFRIVAQVLIDGSDLGQELIKHGYAKPYFGGTKEEW
jgi:endonuclease YncB( thermonuclease family)